MEEEFITKAIMAFLKTRGYRIISFDFPQSGTGIMLHPDGPRDKNSGIIPDIIASKGELMIVMENKPRYCRGDFHKLHDLKTGADFNQDLRKLQTECGATLLRVGVGIPNDEGVVKRAAKAAPLVDFIIAVDPTGKCSLISGNIE